VWQNIISFVNFYRHWVHPLGPVKPGPDLLGISVSYQCGRYPVSSIRCKMLIRWYAKGCSLTWRSFPVASKGRHALQWCQSGRARVASRFASQPRTKDSWSVRSSVFDSAFILWMELSKECFRCLLGRRNFVALHRLIRNGDTQQVWTRLKMLVFVMVTIFSPHLIPKIVYL
jgi:hypothetical protein